MLFIGRRWVCEGDVAGDGANREPMVNWSQESVLVTGGTGSFGKKFIDIMLREYQPIGW